MQGCCFSYWYEKLGMNIFAGTYTGTGRAASQGKTLRGSGTQPPLPSAGISHSRGTVCRAGDLAELEASKNVELHSEAVCTVCT